ncbi:UNVERIFIED_CONTAM: hypothetical protein HDU68_012541 [Siphonaria sp. JEL0065]|nr:hypothetical protein HDU68_012541 [Siphonaria sp. JEL0065]
MARLIAIVALVCAVTVGFIVIVYTSDHLKPVTIIRNPPAFEVEAAPSNIQPTFQAISTVSPIPSLSEIDSTTIPCDNYRSTAGFLNIHGEKATFVWQPLYESTDTSCQHKDPTDNLKILKDSKTLPFYLQDKLVLTYSDSQDRNTIDFVCDWAKGSFYSVALNGSILIPQESALRGDAKLCVIRKNDHVLVWLSVFQYGATMLSSKNGGKFTSDNSTLNTHDRIQHIKTALRHLPKVFFPELCIKHGVKCTVEPEFLTISPKAFAKDFPFPKFSKQTLKALNSLPPAPEGWIPTPDIVITQSGLWDILDLSPDVLQHEKVMREFIPFWKESMQKNLMIPLQEAFGNLVHNSVIPTSSSAPVKNKFLFDTNANGDRVLHHWFLRTTPLPKSQYDVRPTRMNALNEMYRTNELMDGFTGESWGIIDWDQIVRGYELVGPDGTHLIEHGYKAYAQVVLSRLELLGYVV